MSHSISLKEARVMTQALDDFKDEILLTVYRGNDLLPVSEYFPRSVFEELLADPNAAGIRIYFSMNDLKKLHTILVGVDEVGNNLLPADEEEESTMLAERSIRTDFSDQAAVYL